MAQVQAAVQLRRVGRFTLIDRLGAGGQGEVWRVRDAAADVDLALKILDASAEGSAKTWAALEREFAILALLRHPGILRVLPPQRIENHLVLPMELADGGNLTALRGQGYLQIVPVLLEVAAALSYAHSRGVVHRDLKASNVLFDSSGRTKLADFGLAAVLRGSGAAQGIARACGGSPFTASPEQWRGEPPHPADDIYGFGALAYELLAGHHPYFPHFDVGQIHSAVPPLVPARPAPLQLIELVMRMLAKRVDERPRSMHEVAETLELTLNATLALDLTELADLSAGPRESARAATRRPPARPKPSGTAAVGGSAALVAPARTQVTPVGAAAEPQPQVPSAVSETPPVLLSSRPYRDEVSSLRAIPLPPPGERPGWYGGGRKTQGQRGRLLAFGLLCAVGGAAVTLWGSGRLSGGNLPRSLSAVVAQLRGGPPGGVARSATVGRIMPASPAGPSGSSDGASPTARGARIEQRLNAWGARGAAAWDGSDFAAAQRQVLAARALQQARGAAAARRHWRAAAVLLRRLRSQAPRALVAQLKVAEHAVTAGRQQTAARAFALALRIDGRSRQAAAGAREVHALSAARPLLSEARRVGRSGHDARAAYDLRRVLARAPHAAPARAALRRVRGSFRDVGYHQAVRAGLAAIAGGRWYHAQADFLQALVFRPQGIEAAAQLGRVNRALRKRAPRAARLARQQLGSD